MMRRALLVAVALAGCNAASDYARKSKATEAQLYLTRIVRAAKAYSIANAKFPVGTAGLTPATDCCSGPDHKCPVDPKQWQVSPWQDLDISLELEHLFRYSYTSDGKTFTATAVGDLDCDGTAVTWKVTGTYDEQNGPKTTEIERPTNTD